MIKYILVLLTLVVGCSNGPTPAPQRKSLGGQVGLMEGQYLADGGPLANGELGPIAIDTQRRVVTTDPNSAAILSGITAMPQVASTVYHLGGLANTDAGAGSQVTGSSTPLKFACYVCSDAANSTTNHLYIAADSAVVVTAGNAHQGSVLQAGNCAWFPVANANALYAVSASASQGYSAQCY